MKRLSLELKIMLCFTAMFVFVMVATLPIKYLIISNDLYTNAKSLLQSEAERIAEMLVYAEGRVRLDSDVDLIAETGTYIAVYSNNNVLRSGALPQSFDLDVQPQFGNTYTTKSDGHKWIVYDYNLFRNGENVGWIRAAKSLDAVSDIMEKFNSMILKVIPIYIVMTLLGWIFIKRILSPVIQITKTARQIGQGDLSKRINFEGSHDQVGILAETLDEMLDNLEDSFNREKRFSSDVSHELKTPVTAIIVNAEEALSGDKSADEYKESLETILKESRKLNSLIAQLLMMARSKDGNYKHEMELLDISMLTKTIVDGLSDGEENPDIFISSDIEEGIIMLVDQTLYMRLIINLIDNALKYNTPGGWVKLSLIKSKNNVSLSVEDNGIGISKENLPRIWERFFKADQSSINSSPGLGLSIVKWIAELHGGTVHAKSELGKGSCFEIGFVIKSVCINKSLKSQQESPQ